MLRHAVVVALVALAVLADEDTAVKNETADGHFGSSQFLPVQPSFQQNPQTVNYGLPIVQNPPVQYQSAPSYAQPQPYPQPIPAYPPQYGGYGGYWRRPVEPVVNSVCTLDVNFSIAPPHGRGERHENRRQFRAQCSPLAYVKTEHCTQCCKMAAQLLPRVSTNVIKGMILFMNDGRKHCACCAPEMATPAQPVPVYNPVQQYSYQPAQSPPSGY